MVTRMFLLEAFLLIGATAFATVASAAGKQPVEAKFVKMDPKREVLVYTVAIAKDAKPIKQVDLKFRYLDGAGKEITTEEFLWQNNVKGKVQPIEAGKSYEHVDSGAPDNCKSAEITVVRIHFADGSKQ